MYADFGLRTFSIWGNFLMGLYGSPDLTSHNNKVHYNNNMIFCSSCGFQYSKKFRKCPKCGKKHAQPFYNKWWFWLFIIILILSFAPSDLRKINIHTFTDIPEKTGTLQQSGEEDPISEDDYKAKCIQIAYEDLARNPESYINQKALFTGKAIQIQENGTSVVIRLNVTQGEYGIWDDTVYIDYQRKAADEKRILEGDIITVYGEVKGIKTYTAIFGNQVSIPHILGKYIIIN